jgi:hypothetical protein
MIKRAEQRSAKLPFVKRKGKRAVWWNVTPTGKWVEDFTVGPPICPGISANARDRADVLSRLPANHSSNDRGVEGL